MLFHSYRYLCFSLSYWLLIRIESGLQVDDEESGAVEGEGRVAGDERLPGLSNEFLRPIILNFFPLTILTQIQCEQKIWRNFATLPPHEKLWPFWKGSIDIWQSFELTLANFKWYWANNHCWKWNLAIWWSRCGPDSSIFHLIFMRIRFFFSFKHITTFYI